ncbi:hypothetical protein FGO68_gene5253 [Halteria grandinella]|uniref:Protein kinase domain-containing protein n=1 Tax=Halteria grandinella TaxID=5974 RepID=A0A8J8NQD7_HALGN|nr:hypothetical protein FGO68_gene5253 [Halteria grandinella]
MVDGGERILNGYKILRQIGAGSFANVFQVENIETKIRYAMKIYRGEVDEYLMQDPQNEINFLRKHLSPFIIRYVEDFQIEEDYSRRCIVVDYADGGDLRMKMAAMNNKIPEQLALNWFVHICLALAKMHSQGIMHRDIKPENILIVGEVLGGIAKLNSSQTIKEFDLDPKNTFYVGTAQYFAPEKRYGEYQEKVDVWALGIVLYEMLSGGKFPFEYDFCRGGLEDYMTKLPSLELRQLPSEVSQESKDLVAKLLEKDPENRPSIVDIIKTPIISKRLSLITEEFLLGIEISRQVKELLISLGITL